MAEEDASKVWIPAIVDCIARFLPTNEVACSLRVVDKATAAMLRSPEFMTVRLSEPVPHHAFAWRWGRPGAMRDMTLARRRELLCLTAASGAADNLALAARASSCPLTKEVAYAAGRAGQLGTCLALEELGCGLGGAVEGAAAGGHMALCEHLANKGRIYPIDCAIAAAKEGHADTLQWALWWDKEPERGYYDSAQIAEGIAEGCELETLKRWLPSLIVMDTDEASCREVADESHQRMVLAAAAGSPTPDWQAKVEWLESHAFSPTCQAFAAAAKLPDALERFAWLAQRGYPIHPEHEDAVEPLAETAGSGNTAAVLFLAERGQRGDHDEGIGLASAWAATQGHLHVLQALHAAGWRLDAQVVSRCAASGGHLHVVAWLVETPDLGVALDGELFCCAAQSGSVELLAWLRERGCPWDSRAVTAAARSGCVAALEWLAERGCPMPEDGSPFKEAARAVDMLTLECLRQLGCPWGPCGRVFSAFIPSGGHRTESYILELPKGAEPGKSAPPTNLTWPMSLGGSANVYRDHRATATLTGVGRRASEALLAR
ncbi:hypothetical protein GPECTOR_56g349 [Gonium pectorale]|uniref:Ankyrin repeat domain-containing protein n=1 Tax=Gonium pectorale TaxID=33097 RepID=A0A150G658_GONPE|nr:hypothetical protein GPECTOR_56g349 [Gonium pectorale]|eukprot:KXZ45253.1 hypothetical protein GPECTOR_56g349 [Gonium pectorale]